MAYYPDLSPYTYLAIEPDTVNVGWLDQEHDFAKGLVEPGVVRMLFWLCLNQQVRQTRGFHICPYCEKPREDDARVRLSLILARVRTLGSAEIRVRGLNGRVYASPTLICHYVAEHSYHPPEEFLTAVADLPDFR